MTPPIKRLLREWALYRVRDVIPPIEVRRIGIEICKLSPESVRLIELEYCDPRPQKTKAAQLRMSRQMFSARLRWIHEQLAFTMERNNRENA